MHSKAKDPTILRVAELVNYRLDPDSPYPATYPGKLEIEMQDGRVFTCRRPHNKGSKENPMSAAEITEKFYRNALHKISRAQADDICNCIGELENLKDFSLLGRYLNY